MKILTSFSGKFGDILWSLPTVRHISRVHGQPVEMMLMPAYSSLIPLLEQQSYISKAFVNEQWICEGSPAGDQPAIPQNHEALTWDYDKIYHLTYRHHPGIHYTGKSLIDFIAVQQGYELQEPVCPFIEVASDKEQFIAFAFNSDYASEKKVFWDTFSSQVKIDCVDVSKLPWHAAAEVINSAQAFIGCRSANWVIAHGVAQKNIFVYEPNSSRGSFAFSNVFGNPHWKDTNHNLILPPQHWTPEKASEAAIEWVSKVSIQTEGAYV